MLNINNDNLSNGLKKIFSIAMGVACLIILSACTKEVTTNTNTPQNTNSTTQENTNITSSSDISSHNSASDCWTIINGTTYNITDYIISKEHPSGNADLIAICGKDGTRAFDSIRKHSSAFTSNVLSQYKIQ